MPASSVGLAYAPVFLEHDTGPGHPERPARLQAIMECLQATPLWHDLARWEPAPTSDAVLELVHKPAYVRYIRDAIAEGGGALDPDTITSPDSMDAALRAAGACVEAVDRVSRGDLRSAFCVVRPPGHHATPSRAMGFCLFNNVAVAAAWLREHQRAERVAILDYDVHHGNGTQDAFYERGDVLYVSTHQYPFYPGTGAMNQTGRGPGEGTTINIPLPAGAGDPVFQRARESIIEPAVRRYRPDFLLLSLGFDAFWGDELALLTLSLGDGYAPLLASARALADDLCDGRLVVALEGGYNLEALAAGGEMVCRVLLGLTVQPDPLGPPEVTLPLAEVEPILEVIRRLHGLA